MELADTAPNALGPSLVGTLIGGVYRLEEEIGHGGMGRVYRATHTHLPREYAIKVLSSKESSEGASRFIREAKAISKIEHPNIVDLHNVALSDDGSPYLVMELLRGQTLADYLEDERPTLSITVSIIKQICEALAQVHEIGIIHRDLKSDNIFLIDQGDETPQVKILDFGIARMLEDEDDDVRMTRTDQVLGTPLYMSPEQAKGEREIDHRADIYALGVILYEMLCGRPPFVGDNYLQLMWKHGSEEPKPLRDVCDTVPQWIESITMRALAKNPEARFQSMSDFALSIDEASVVSSPPKRWLTYAFAIGIFVVLTTSFYFVVGHKTQPPTVERQPVVSTPSERSSTPIGEISPIANQPDDSQSPPKTTINSLPQGANVWVDGKEVGKTPLVFDTPKIGATIRLRKPGYRSRVTEVTATTPTTLTLELRKKRPRDSILRHAADDI